MGLKKNLFNKISCLFADRRDNRGRTALYRAAKAGNLNEVKELLKCGANTNIPNHRGLTPLHQAAYWGEVEIVKLLISHGAKVNTDTTQGWTPLHSAALSAGLKNRKEAMDILIQHGANPHEPDSNGWGPIHYAKLWENHGPGLKKLQDFLDRHGRDVDYQQPDIDKLGIDKPDIDLAPPHSEDRQAKPKPPKS